MAVAPQFYFEPFVEGLFNGSFNIGGDTLKLALLPLSALPAGTEATIGELTQITAGGGYPANGFTLTVTSSAQVGGVYKALIDDYLFAATGTVDTFQIAVLYSDTAVGIQLICWYVYASAIDLTAGQEFLFDFEGSLGALSGSFAP
jgi:hypothetical protein